MNAREVNGNYETVQLGWECVSSRSDNLICVWRFMIPLGVEHEIVICVFREIS